MPRPRRESIVRLAFHVALQCAAGSVLMAPAIAAQSVSMPQRSPRAPIDFMHIDRENVFDRSEESTSWLARAANGLHIVTRERVITRELLVHDGEPFDSAAAAESERNLRKLGIFRDVKVDSVRTDSGLVARVTTYDSWTTQPYTVLKTSGDQVTWGIGITEKNLLGLQIKGTYRYTSDPDRSTTQFGANLPRLFKNRLGIGGSYEQLSDGEKSRVLISAPFTSLAGKGSFETEYWYKDESILRFFSGEEVASDTLRHLLSRVTARFGHAPRASASGFLRLGMTVQARREDYSQLQVTGEDRTVFGELELSAEKSTSLFAVVRGYRTLTGREDVDLSPTVRVALWLAPNGWGYARDGIGPAIRAQVGRPFTNGFVQATFRAASLFTNQGLDSGSVVTSIVSTYQPAPRHSITVSGDIGAMKNPYPGEEFDLGFNYGPRGFPLHAFTGDRAFFTMAEYRWVAIQNLWNLFAIGVAGFAEYGGAWYTGSARRTGRDMGVGLRLGSTRTSSGAAAARLDLSRRFANDVLTDAWVFSVGTGFPFEKSR